MSIMIILVSGVLLPEMACDPMQHADLGAVVMQEGLANVCLVTSAMTLVRAKIETNIPRKRKGQCSQHDKVFCCYLMLVADS